jgi:predicted ATP-grasp superfamily ATP-dependent carboligase
MKTIFICEYVTGGGYINKKISKKLFLQAKSILKSLIVDFNKIPNLKIVYTWDYRFKKLKKIKNVECFEIKRSPLKKWNSIIKKSDIFFPIAPETENKLIELIRLNKFKKKMLSNEINAIKISSSKYKTYKFLQKNSIPTLKTFNLKKNDLKIAKNWVAKPDDGAGCEENYIFSNKKNLFNFLNLHKNFVVQPLVKGVSYSANVIPIKNKVFILNFNKQKISYEKKKMVFKGTKFIKRIPFETKIKENIRNIYKNLAGLNSFFGIDFIISNKKIFFLDINPRITTSYENISKNLKINAAKKILNTL